MYPSLLAHIFGALILLLAVITIFCNQKTLLNEKPYNMVILLLLLSVTITAHGISHLGLEKNYGFNPLKIFS